MVLILKSFQKLSQHIEKIVPKTICSKNCSQSRPWKKSTCKEKKSRNQIMMWISKPSLETGSIFRAGSRNFLILLINKAAKKFISRLPIYTDSTDLTLQAVNKNINLVTQSLSTKNLSGTQWTRPAWRETGRRASRRSCGNRKRLFRFVQRSSYFWIVLLLVLWHLPLVKLFVDAVSHC